jgi:soluble lytic murein transglycosylase
MSTMVSRRKFLSGVGVAATWAVLPVIASAPALAMPSGLAVEAAKKALTGDFLAAGDLAKQSGDQAAVKFVEMLYLRDHGPEAGYARVMAFLNAAPNWPLQQTLLKRAELALYDNSESAAVVLAHFRDRDPDTPFGALALARANYTNGDSAAGKKWLREAWGNFETDPTLEAKCYAEFSSRLSSDDHRWRFSRLVFAQQGGQALRFANARLSGDYQNAARVAQALISFQSGADKKFAALPAGQRNDLALLYVLTRYYRRAEQYDKARDILVSIPSRASAMGDAEAWFEERRTIVRRSLGPRQSANWKQAYVIAKNHGIDDGNFAVEGEFLAGWVALRYLKDSQTALTHFSKLQQLAPDGTEQARAAYWLGRTQLALGNNAAAKASFQTAARHSTVFYGQLAREQIGLGSKPEDITPGSASPAAAAKVEGDEVVRAFRLMAAAGTKNQLNIFLWPLANRFKSVDELNAVANIVQNAGGTSSALRLAKAASQRGIDIDSWSYPVYGLPNWAQIGKPIEKSLVFALSRQESEFDAQAGSSVGAQGLMQLMPGTARLVARQYRVGYSAAQLHDASYNVKLGAAHLADLVDGLNGSYVLTLVAYNAGPRRATEWVDYYGDPRGGQIDPIDWVECIPFNETRQYVQKVMQNLHVYRSRLAPDTVRPMTADLKRGTPTDVTVASTSSASAAAGCRPRSMQALVSGCD